MLKGLLKPLRNLYKGEIEEENFPIQGYRLKLSLQKSKTKKTSMRLSFQGTTLKLVKS